MRRAVTLRPLYPDYRFQLGTLLMDLEKTRDVLAEFEIALMMNPEYEECSLHLASVLLANGEPQKAIAVLNTSSGREWPAGRLLAAQCYHEAGDEELAHKMLDELMQSDPGCPALARFREEISPVT
jgi:tetratricopeptide (TPR) repeat protein